MSTKLESTEHEGFTIEIHYDEDPPNPHEEYDNLGVFVLSNRSWNLANDLDIDFDAFSSWNEVRDHLVAEHGAKLILPVWGYEHSGLALTAGARTYPFDCPWDSGMAGLIFMTEKGMEEATDPEEYLKGELEEYNAYLNGHVYGFVVKDSEGEHVDSCWGFYGYDYCVKEAESIAEWEAKNHITRREQALASGSLPMSAEGLVTA